jgi:hypothetical protein
MRFTFTVEVEVEREEGKFASRDDLAEQLQDALAGSDPGVVEGDNGGVYSVVQWDVEETPQTKSKGA